VADSFDSHPLYRKIVIAITSVAKPIVLEMRRVTVVTNAKKQETNKIREPTADELDLISGAEQRLYDSKEN
jgi:hypothetical protein